MIKSLIFVKCKDFVQYNHFAAKFANIGQNNYTDQIFTFYKDLICVIKYADQIKLNLSLCSLYYAEACKELRLFTSLRRRYTLPFEEMSQRLAPMCPT